MTGNGKTGKLRIAVGMAVFIIAGMLLPAGLTFAGWLTPSKVPYHPQILQQVENSLRAVPARCTKRPVVVFDLDHTLFDSRPRIWRILQEFALTLPESKKAQRELIQTSKMSDISYLVTETLQRIGIRDPGTIEEGLKYWIQHFAHEGRCVQDGIIPGGPAYVKRLYEAGAYIVYLTARAKDWELLCTVESLEKSGYPIGLANTQLIMKPDPNMRAVDYKSEVFKDIDGIGCVVACFENEPKNINAMARRWPEAAHVFLDTDFDPRHPVELLESIHRIASYE